MAAGESRRWGADNKLLTPIDGQPMVRRTAEAILKSTVRPVLIVTGHNADQVKAALEGLSVSFHHAQNFADGMSASLNAGIAAVPITCDAALICLGDMPFVRADTFERLADAYTGQAALFPTYRGQRGNPVLLNRALFGQIQNVSGDEGARQLLWSIPDQVGEVAIDDPGILRDVDRPDALRDTLGS